MTSTASAPPLGTKSPAPAFLPLPQALRQNRSFAQLARLLGISSTKEGSDSGSDDGQDDDALSINGDEDGDSGEIDEESLMWDAQTALIAHQPDLAAKYYATAALPPYRSSAACLALGNLLARGSSLSSHPDSELPTPQSIPEKPPLSQSPQPWFASFFKSSSPPAISPPPTPLDTGRRQSFVSHGWSLPTDGKRVIRDVEGMGKAGGWLILGIGWIIDAEPTLRGISIAARDPSMAAHDSRRPSDSDMIVFSSKGKGRAEPQSQPAVSSSSSADSFDLPTPDDGELTQSAGQKIRLLYNLVIPLLHLYRHGHIQRHDPVALPPLAPSQLPLALRPQGDKEKGRNVWSLGSIVATKVLELHLLSTATLTKEESMKQQGIILVCNYILGITSPPEVAETAFKTVLRCGPSGLDVPDDLIHQAYRRLNVILRATGGSPLSPSTLEANPMAQLRPGRKPSTTSLLSVADSMANSSLRLMTPVKSSASLASLSHGTPTTGQHDVCGGAALQSLHNLQRRQDRIQSAQRKEPSSAGPWWPNLRGWALPIWRAPVIEEQPSEVQQERRFPALDKHKAPIRAVASSPQLSTARRLPFEPTHAVAAIDPELAALELASALTKHVTCSVCSANGVNFPNCRKCGLTFCSRKCRVDEAGAGDGRKHICGVWESRHPQQGAK